MYKIATRLTVTALCAAAAIVAQGREFTSSDGKKLPAEVVAVRDGKASLKVASGKIFKVPLDRLSEADQAFLKSWAKDNPSFGLNDLRFAIRKNRSSERKDAGAEEDKNKREKTSNIVWKGYLQNNTRSAIDGISISYTIYKRTSSRGEGGSRTNVEEIVEEENVGSLGAGEKHEFESNEVKETDRSQKATKDAKASSHRETVFGGHFVVKVNGKEVSSFSDPRGFLERYEAEKKRDEEREERASR